jgi:hypothetical protein
MESWVDIQELGVTDAEERIIEDGVWALDQDVEVFYAHPQNKQETLDFINKHPEFAIASAYETFTVLLLSKKPTKRVPIINDTGFNYGSTNVISCENCNRVLILAQND